MERVLPDIDAHYGSTTQTSSTATESAAATTSEPAAAGLTEVHIIGTKYTDYFTDGVTTYSFPGDPNIDSHFNEKDAPIPTHEGLTWVHTTGGYLYDTPSGDLEVGDYAVQPSGSYIENAPPFVSSTSTTPAMSGDSTAPASDTTSTADSSSSTPQTDSSATTRQSNSSTPTTTTDTTATTTP